MFTKSSFLVLLTVALSATSALAASDVGSKGAVSRRHHTPSKLSRSVAPSIKFSAKRSLRKKQEAKLARGLKAVNARGTNKLSRRGRLTEDERIEDERIEDEEIEDERIGSGRTGGGNRGEEDTTGKDTQGGKDTFNSTGDDSLNKPGVGDVDEVYNDSDDDEPFEEVSENDSEDKDGVVTSGRFESDNSSGDETENDGFGSQNGEKDLPTQLDNDDTLGEEDEVSSHRGGDSDRTSGNNRITLDEDEDEDDARVTGDKGRVTEEDEGRVTGDKGRVTEEDEGRVTGDNDRVTEEDGDEVTGKSSRITRADDSDFDKIARAEGIRRAPSGRWLGRRFK